MTLDYLLRWGVPPSQLQHQDVLTREHCFTCGKVTNFRLIPGIGWVCDECHEPQQR